jgi:uncharacterized protein (DUF1501 family)
MNRRRFLQVAGIAGLAVMAPIAVRETRAGSNKYKGPFWIMVNAGGGWDPTMLTDPKGGTDPKDPKQVNHSYSPDQIGHAGAIAYAPTSYDNNGTTLMTAQDFFTTHHKRLCVMNGIDTSTNNHDAGSRTIWSGQLAEGYPSFAAMVAAAATTAQPVPLAYLSNGGYDATAGIISLTRVGGTDALQRLAFTNEQNPNDPKTGHYHTPNTAARIAAAQEARLKAAQQKTKLPTVASSMGSLFMARQSDGGLADLGALLKSANIKRFPDDFPDVSGVGGIGELDSLVQQVQIALLCFQAGVAVSANLDMGGYDSHDNNDNRQSRQMMILCFALDFLFKQIDAAGLTDQVYVVVGSDFGRTPYYNNNQGKDHWNITSMMFAGPKIQGDRVIGATDDAFKPLTINASTLKLDANGERIGPNNIHMALRKLAGLSNGELDKQFGLPGDYMPFFG